MSPQKGFRNLNHKTTSKVSLGALTFLGYVEGVFNFRLRALDKALGTPEPELIEKGVV